LNKGRTLGLPQGPTLEIVMFTRLGQNFLTDENVAEKIADLANIKGRNVIAIGPAKGILTKYMAQSARKVLAVEIDESLAIHLKTKLILASKSCRNKCDNKKNYNNLDIITDDILKLNLPELVGENNFQPHKVVANLPYYITSKIIRLFLETKYPPAEMILMVQKEVGERIVALDGKESILSISVKFYAEPEILFEVSREKFSPVPEVDSVVIKIARKKIVPNVDTKKFFSLVRAGFSSKRKTLVNNLSASSKIPKVELSEVLKKAGLDPAVRAEKLGLQNWLELLDSWPEN